MNLSDPSLNFILMSNFKLFNLTKTKSYIILSNLPPITNVPIVNFMQTLDEIDNEYNKLFLPWLLTVITICSTLVACPLIFYASGGEGTKECYQCMTSFKKKSLKECPVVEMELIAFGTKANLNARIQKALEEKVINPRSYEKYMNINMDTPSQHAVTPFVPLYLSWKEGEIH